MIEAMGIKEIIAVRKANGIKQYDFSQYIDVPIGTWSNVEIGNQPLYKDVRAKAIKALKDLGCDFSILQTPEKFDELPKYIGRGENRQKHETVELPKETTSAEKLVEVAFPHQEMPQDANFSNFHKVASEIADTLVKKNHDYGDSFYDVYKRFGDISTFIRLSDKLGRMSTLINGTEKVKDEPLEDVLRDIAGYCILTLESKQRLKQQEG